MINNHVTDNVTQLPKSAAKIAAAFLVLTSLPVTPAKDVQRARQAKVFVEQESYAQPQRGSMVVVINSAAAYNSATDVRRRAQDKTFIEQDSFAQPQRGYLLASLTTNAAPYQTQTSVINQVIENVSWSKPQRGTAVVLAQVAPIVQSSDIFIGQDTYGWPPEPIDFFSPGQRGTNAVLNAFTTYNPGTDVRRAQQAKVFVEGDSFVQPAHINYVINNTFAYNPARDVRFTRQAKFFVEGDVFIAPKRPLPISINFTPYAFATDVRRAKQQQVSQEGDTFHRPQPFNEIVTNGTAAPPVSAQITSIELEVTEATRGTINLAWTPFPLSNLVTYQIYINEVPVVAGITVPRVASITGLVVDTDYFIKIVGFPQLGFPRQSNQVFYRYGTTEIQYYTVPSGPLPAPDV